MTEHPSVTLILHSRNARFSQTNTLTYAELGVMQSTSAMVVRAAIAGLISSA